MLNIGVLCSGALGLSTLEHIVKNHSVQFVLTDKKSDAIIKFSKKKGIPVFAGNPRNGKGLTFIKPIEVDIIASINYLFLIEEDIIKHPKKLAFNIHGSLLPKYRGRTPHVWAIINGEKQAGITAHIIDANCDTGDIIHQLTVKIESENTGADILKKYAELYIPLVDKVLLAIENDDLKSTPQDNAKATYFGKRTPIDGEINWDWMKERIRNWVRAQANPYPGAFSFLNNKKIIINKVDYSDLGYSDSMANGSVLSNDPLIIKTPNGALEIKEYTFSFKHKPTINKLDILGK